MTLETLTSSLATGFQTISNDAISAIGTVVPYALPVLGAILVVMVAIRVFKRAAK